MEFIQLRDGKSIDLEDGVVSYLISTFRALKWESTDDDFDAFKAYAFNKGYVRVKIDVTQLSVPAVVCARCF